MLFFRLDPSQVGPDAPFSIYRIYRVHKLNDEFREDVMETQNWRAELRVVVAGARRELIRRDASARASQPGSRAHLRICLGKLDSRLTCSLVASPLSADSSLPLLGNPQRPPSLAHAPRFPSAYQRLAPFLVGEYPVCP